MPRSTPSVDRLIRALDDPTRRRVVERLSRGPAAVSDLARPFKMALPSFVQHLSVLESAGLVRSRKTGRVRTYEINPAKLQKVEHWLAEQRRVWERRLDSFDDYVIKLKEQRMREFVYRPDPELDLVLERTIDVPPELVWEAWTKPEHLKVWFCPRPWGVSHCEMDVRPGGIFRTVMRSPEGKEFDGGAGCFLDVVPNRRLVWTDALGPGYRPNPRDTTDPHAYGEDPPMVMTAMLLLEPAGSGTKYTAIAMHADVAGRKKHEDMGFAQGWATALDQLVEHAKSLR